MYHTERHLWEILHGPHSAEAIDIFTTAFERMNIPNDLRALVACCAKHHPKLAENGCLNITTGPALEFIAMHGRNYTPRQFVKPMPEPLQGKCHANAWHWIRATNKNKPADKKMVYVEGIAIGVKVRPVMIHAWNASNLHSTNAMDWTFYPHAKWIKYFGIPFTEQEYAQCCRILDQHPKRRARLLFQGTNFKRLEPFLTQILARRKAVSP